MDLAGGPSVEVTITGTKALVTLTALIQSNNQNGSSYMGFAISGGTTRAASDATALVWDRGERGECKQASRISLKV